MNFQLTSEYQPTGDQPLAIQQLVEGIQRGDSYQTLLGVTGSGKTFTVANVIQQVQKPTLVLSHNKTLVAQLYGEFLQFFPENAVEYFVSYYDYYQPEAFIPSSNTYIEKDLAINDEIEKLRLKTTSSLLSGRRDIVVVASVSCIYGAGNPKDYEDSIIRISVGQKLSRQTFLHKLVDCLYSRTTADFTRGSFRVKGDTVDVFVAYGEFAYRIVFLGNDIEALEIIDPASGLRIETVSDLAIFPANLYVTPRDRLMGAIYQIQDDLMEQIDYFKKNGLIIEAKRLEERVTLDMEMMREIGYCSGIENYSRYLDRRQPGERPFCLLDYFPEDFLLVVDESHVTLPQVRAMFGGDRSRKINLVEHGFRLPAALDNRPLMFDEFERIVPQTIYVSATPANYELNQCGGVVVEQLIRPTGLLDPEIEIRPSKNQVDDLVEEIRVRTEMGDRTLVTTLTKRMAEDLNKFLSKLNIRCSYIHSEVKTLDRVEILRALRMGEIDVLIGVNLLREGLDLPEVSFVAIMDADKEGFLRNDRSLIQTIGRAARNERGKVILFANRITDSIQKTLDDNAYKRKRQRAYNEEHGIIPRTILKSKEAILKQTSVADARKEKSVHFYSEDTVPLMVEDPVYTNMNPQMIQKTIEQARKNMLQAAKNMEFMEAAMFRDEIERLEKILLEK